jgi:transposase
MHTRTDQPEKLTPATNEVLMIAIELSAKRWKLAFDDGRRGRARIATIDAWDFDALQHQVGKACRAFNLPEGVRVVSCYEAGREGFSVHRRLAQLAIDNVVIDAASVEVSRRARRAKTDRLDAEMLVSKLAAHRRGERAFSVARVPAPEDEGVRHEQRSLEDLKVERGRHRVRIQSLLLTEGIVSKWSPRVNFAELRTVDGRQLAPSLVERLRSEAKQVELVQQEISRIENARKEAVAKKDPSHRVELVKVLSSLKGIGTTGAYRMVLECFGWRKFANRREVAGCLGLAPSPFASGKVDREQGISKLGNARLRALLIELSWLWVRYQPTSKIARWFDEKFARGAGRSRRIGIVAVARKLAIALWKLIEFGVVPEGALMKT